MPANVIPNGEAFAFGALALHGSLQQATDTDEQRVAEHEILKRNGAILEGMGWKARRFEAKCVFVGAGFRAEVERLRSAIRKKSEDDLTHPLYGRIKARCTRIVGALSIPAAANAAEVTLSFIEAGIDPNENAIQSQSVGKATQALALTAADVLAYATVYASAAASIESLSALAAEYAAAVAFAAQSGTPDPTQTSALGGIEAAALTSIEAVQADDAATHDADRFDAVTAIELVYSAAIEATAALDALRPPLVRHVIGAPMSYLAFMATLYGSQALDREAEFALYNPSINTPHMLPAGAVVYMPAATG